MKYHSHLKYTFTFVLMMLMLGLSMFYAATTSQATEDASDEEDAEDTEAVVLYTTEYDDTTILPDLVSNSAIVMDANTGAILYQKNAYEAHYPASITKVMTCLLALENCELDETVTMSYDAIWGIERDSSHIALSVDEQISMEEALYGLMLASANEVAWGIGEHVSGTIDDFAELMTSRAAELGCVNTHFTNANGLHDDEHYTCCYDMALIAKEALTNETFRTITSSISYTIAPTNLCDEERTVWQHNKLIFPGSYYYYEYCEGGKTGYTTMANHSLVVWAEKDGMELICVLMDCVGSKRTFTDATAIFNYCFNNYDYLNPLSDYTFDDEATAATLSLLDATYGTSGDQDIVLSVDRDYALAFNMNNNADKLSITFELYDEATLLEGEDETEAAYAVGRIAFAYDGETLGYTEVTVTGYDETQVIVEAEEVETEEASPANVVNVVEEVAFNMDQYLQDHLQKIIFALAVIVIICFIASLIRVQVMRKKRHAEIIAQRNSYITQRRDMLKELDTELDDHADVTIPEESGITEILKNLE